MSQREGADDVIVVGDVGCVVRLEVLNLVDNDDIGRFI